MRWLALAGMLLALVRQPACAWGDDGHRITGHIAATLLTQQSREQLLALFGTDDLAQLSTWMDDERESLNRRLPGSSRWHYENRTACGASNSANSCPKGQCITRQIARSREVLKNPQATRAQRADAVRILVHLLGDLHQPLHLIDNNDRGGNDFYVRLPREKNPRRLHEVWDTSLVRMNLRRGNPARYASTLLTRFDANRASWQTGSIDEWASETHALALQLGYRALPTFACNTRNEGDTATVLPTEYLANGKTVVAEQLAKAGIRMAAVLNELLSRQPLDIATQSSGR